MDLMRGAAALAGSVIGGAMEAAGQMVQGSGQIAICTDRPVYAPGDEVTVLGLGRVVALYHRAPTSYQIH
jgi:hypothetical protein